MTRFFTCANFCDIYQPKPNVNITLIGLYLPSVERTNPKHPEQEVITREIINWFKVEKNLF
jgi:hypothetical protein